MLTVRLCELMYGRRFPETALSNAENSIISSFDVSETFALDTLCPATRYERFQRKVSNS